MSIERKNMSRQQQRVALEEARLNISETLATANTMPSDGLDGNRLIGDYLSVEYLKLVKGCHHR